jgi:4-alpha-glucanotransferase
LRSVSASHDGLRRLASAHGIQLTYTGQAGRRVRTSTDALLATLDALGVEVAPNQSVEEQIEELTRDRNRGVLEPVLVLSTSGEVSSAVVLPSDVDPARCELTITREDGVVESHPLPHLAFGPVKVSDGFLSRDLALGGLALPVGYHEISITGPGIEASALLLVPPLPVVSTNRSFGVFAPIYSLRGTSDWGVGTFTDLAELADHAGSVGAEIVGTLPMFPTFFDPPVDPSPYLPVSRLFVNELFIDVESLPEFAASAAARALVGSADLRRDLAALRATDTVDYGEVMAHKRRVLELCAVEWSGSTSRQAEYETFRSGRPDLESYADFRAAGERVGARWPTWPTRPGLLPESLVDPVAQRYHRYVQFVSAEQLAAAATPMVGRARAGLYLDLPVGVHPEGFDTWSQSSLFAPATVGAPPDRLAPEGQAWGFPPLHPQRIRQQRYRYVIRCLRNLFSYARLVRIDHVLGLQRLFWIPRGAGAESGAYVRYYRDELMAIVAIEAARANTVVVGEDLGTVPAGIRRAMDQEAMLHSFVYQFVATPQDPHPQPSQPSLASLGSHDLPRFAGFLRGADIDDRVARGVTTEAAAQVEKVSRRRLLEAVKAPLSDATPDDIFNACIGSLAAGPAPYVMVDLADIEGETVPDNRPGTGPEAGNWRHRLARPLPSILGDRRVNDVLDSIAGQRLRREPEGVSA